MTSFDEAVWLQLLRETAVIHKIYTGTVGTTSTEISLGAAYPALRVININDTGTKKLYFSVDNETNWLVVPAKVERMEVYNGDTLHIKGAVADCDYEVITLERV